MCAKVFFTVFSLILVEWAVWFNRFSCSGPTLTCFHLKKINKWVCALFSGTGNVARNVIYIWMIVLQICPNTVFGSKTFGTCWDLPRTSKGNHTEMLHVWILLHLHHRGPKIVFSHRSNYCPSESTVGFCSGTLIYIALLGVFSFNALLEDFTDYTHMQYLIYIW